MDRLPPARVATRSGAPAAAVGSVALHGTLLLAGFLAGSRIVIPPPAQVYRVDLVAAPSPPAVTAVPEASKETRKPAPKEEAAPRAKRRERPEAAKVERAKPAESKPSPATPTADETIRLEGAPFLFPDYLNNLVLQVKRRWRPPTGPQRLSAEIAFLIHRDGRVTDIEWVRRSGSPIFDLEARGAIEAAGRQQAFGPLPEGYPAEQLRVIFLFDPAKY